MERLEDRHFDQTLRDQDLTAVVAEKLQLLCDNANAMVEVTRDLVSAIRNKQ